MLDSLLDSLFGGVGASCAGTTNRSQSLPIGLNPKEVLQSIGFPNGTIYGDPCSVGADFKRGDRDPFATVTDIDRKLVIGGLRSKGGRGFHAARVTPLDAARLLTAILASAQANLAVGAVDRYARTQVDRAIECENFAASVLPISRTFSPPGTISSKIREINFPSRTARSLALSAKIKITRRQLWRFLLLRRPPTAAFGSRGC